MDYILIKNILDTVSFQATQQYQLEMREIKIFTESDAFDEDDQNHIDKQDAKTIRAQKLLKVRKAAVNLVTQLAELEVFEDENRENL